MPELGIVGATAKVRKQFRPNHIMLPEHDSKLVPTG